MLDWLLWMAMSRLLRDRARVMVRDRARLMVGVGVGVGVRVLVYGDVSPHRVGEQLEHAQVISPLYLPISPYISLYLAASRWSAA